MQPELVHRYVRTKHLDHQGGVAFRLQHGTPLVRLRGDEERSLPNPAITGLKPDFFP